MWKALIADDEPKIRRGLRSLLERIDGEITVVAEAEDGQEAFEQAQAQLPDILFLDIRMPFLNGLELIEKLDQVSFDWLVIIISGHDEFDYARRAVSLKVFEYLLKPVDEEELRRTLERAKNELTLRRATNRYVVWARQQLIANKEIFQERFIIDWLRGILSKSDIEETQSFLSLNLTAIQTLVALRLEERPTKNNSLRCGYRNLLTYTIKAAVKELLPPSFLVVIDLLDTVVALGDQNKKQVEKIIPAIEMAIEDATHHRALIVLMDTRNENDGALKTVQDLYEEAHKELSKKENLQTFVLLAEQYIEKNYSYPELSLEEAATELEISPGYLSRLIKQATGYSFIDFLSRVRINHAMELMLDPAIKIYEVAEKVGYRSQHYFSRAFKNVLGFPPSEYKRGGSLKNDGAYEKNQ